MSNVNLNKAATAMFSAARSDGLAQAALASAFAIARKHKIDFALIRRDYLAGFWSKKFQTLNDANKALAYAFADSAGKDAKKLLDGQVRRNAKDETLHASARKSWSRAIASIGEAAINAKGATSATSEKAKAKRQVKAGQVKTTERTPDQIQRAIAEIVAPPNASKAGPADLVMSFASMNNALMGSGKKHAKDIPGNVASAIATGTALIAKAIADWRIEQSEADGVKAESEAA